MRTQNSETNLTLIEHSLYTAVLKVLARKVLESCVRTVCGHHPLEVSATAPSDSRTTSLPSLRLGRGLYSSLKIKGLSDAQRSCLSPKTSHLRRQPTEAATSGPLRWGVTSSAPYTRVRGASFGHACLQTGHGVGPLYARARRVSRGLFSVSPRQQREQAARGRGTTCLFT